MELKEKLYLVDEEGDKFMGIGVLWLLEAIDRNSSLRGAASELGLSYSKAYGMLDKLEKNLGKDMVTRKKGGSNREGVTLTPFARSFIELFKGFQSKVKAAANAEYKVFQEELEKLNGR